MINWGVKVLGLRLGARADGGAPLVATFGGEQSSVLPVHAPAGVGTYSAGIIAAAVSLGAPTARAAMDALAPASINMHLSRR